MEIAKVKMEEKEKSRKEILELRQDMERTFELKAEALINREKNAIDRLQKQQEVHGTLFSKHWSYIHWFHCHLVLYLAHAAFICFCSSCFQIEEKDVYMQRQAVLKEIEIVRNRETELRLRNEAFEK